MAMRSSNLNLRPWPSILMLKIAWHPVTPSLKTIMQQQLGQTLFIAWHYEVFAQAARSFCYHACFAMQSLHHAAYQLHDTAYTYTAHLPT